MSVSSPKICVIGIGVVGGALRRWFESQGTPAGTYDPPKGLDDARAIDDADIVFICVPTPHDAERGFDDSYVTASVAAIPGEKLVVIKSTVLPGTTDALQVRFSQHRFIFNPEFIREATAYEDLVHPDRQVIGCTSASAGDAGLVLSLLPRAPHSRACTAREAEMAKYVANSFLAVKVSFANEIFDLCESLGIGYDAVREITGADRRIGTSHLDVLDAGYRGYGGKCLPKDSKALLQLARRTGTPMRVLAAADDVNARLTAPKKRVRRTQDSAAVLEISAQERRQAA